MTTFDGYQVKTGDIVWIIHRCHSDKEYHPQRTKFDEKQHGTINCWNDYTNCNRVCTELNNNQNK